MVFVGEHAPDYANGYLGAGGRAEAVTLARDNEEAWSALREELDVYAVILIKGSRKMKMETLADRIARGI
jgi:UDP-N-acetylmuramyl pentapeptide synthase